MIAPIQVRMARAALGISAKDLAKLAKVGEATVLRFERNEGRFFARTAEKIQAALEKKGIVFLGADEQKPGGPGIRWAKKKQQR